MKIYLEEKIGDPNLFCGRKKELEALLLWVEKIKKRLSPSRSMVSRRKTGKTAILQRLFNIVFHQNDKVVPFYYEVGETSQWAVDFCRDFFMTFICHYTAFRSRNPYYLSNEVKKEFDVGREIVKKEGLDFLVSWINSVQSLAAEENTHLLWGLVRDAPRKIAEQEDMRVMQIIDEFQYLNRKIYWDKNKTRLANDFAQGYMSTAEYKNAPLIVAGSWVGWLMHDIMKMPARFQLTTLDNMPEDEAIETIYRYSSLYEIPVTDETAHLIAEISEGSPFYISGIMRSLYPDKDLTTREGVLATLEYETLNRRGTIYNTWMEYIHYAFSTINDRNAKKIVLYLCKNRDREITRKELIEKVVPDMDDYELEKKLKALVYSDIIEQGSTNFRYKGVSDNIFDKVFRGVYAEEIEGFDPAEITNEYKELFDKIQKKYRKLQGKHNYLTGKYAEFTFILKLTYHAFKENDKFKSMMENLPENFEFVEYESVWSWYGSPVYRKNIQIDIFARAKDEFYSLVGEIKKRKDTKFSKAEAEKFVEKAKTMMEIEEVKKAVLFVFSQAGFTDDALEFFKNKKIAWTTDVRWIQPL